MKIIIENIGVLKYAEYSLADLTVVCGNNSTGKTYAIYALLGFLDYFKKGYTVNVPLKDVQSLLANGSMKIKLDYSLVSLSRNVKDACKHFIKYLPKILAARETYFYNASFNIELLESDVSILEEYNRTYRTGKNGLLELVKSNNDLTITFLQSGLATLDNDKSVSTRSLIAVFQRVIGDAIKDILFGNIFPECFIASAERTGAVIFNDELNTENKVPLKEFAYTHDSQAQDISDRINYVSYALPIQREVAFIRNLKSISKGQSELSIKHPDVLGKISDIVGGDYKVSTEGISYIPVNSKSEKFTIGECGSAVRSLLDIYFYLKGIARPGQLLIIEEPEMNLHPENQRKLARLISLLVNYGIRVLVTTHSDYILKELNTLIMLKSRRNQHHISAVMEKYGYSDDELLDDNKIKVFVAQKSGVKLGCAPRKVNIQTLVEAHVDPIYGVSTDNFDETIIEMNQIQNYIVFGGNG